MIFNLNIVGTDIILTTDDKSVSTFFEYTYSGPKYNFFLKKYTISKLRGTIYEKKSSKGGIFTFVLKIGWGIFLLNIFKPYISPDDKKKVLDSVYSSNYRSYPFPNLRDYQNEDLLHILKYKYGLYSVYTSYGKTQVIATLVNYSYNEMGKNTLILVPNSKCKDEIVKRCKDVFDIDIPSKDGLLNIINTGGVSASKKFKDENLLIETQKELDKVEWVLCDEVEYVVSPGGRKVLDMCRNSKVRYGFSGTADKISGNMITFANGLSDSVTNNKNIIDYFGQSLVFRAPVHLDIDLISIRSSCFNNLQFTDDDFKEDQNVYLNILNKIWTDNEVCKLVSKLPSQYPNLFIPVNNLNSIISNWINNYWKGVWRVLLISGAGYTYYDINGDISNVDLKGACELIKNGLVDVIPGTSSSYRALDLPGLTNILLIQGSIAGVVLQSIGRVARGSKVNIIDIKPKPWRSIPVYNKGVKHRSEMIKEYYKYCNINSLTRDESEF